jgi:hypothetical protein
MEEDRETIGTCGFRSLSSCSDQTLTPPCKTGIKRTKLRLVRCRARMAMNDRDRLNDARADSNLADVARIPAPWDVKPTDGSAGVPQVINSSS